VIYIETRALNSNALWPSSSYQVGTPPTGVLFQCFAVISLPIVPNSLTVYNRRLSNQLTCIGASFFNRCALDNRSLADLEAIMRLSQAIPQYDRQLAANGRSAHTRAAYLRDLFTLSRWMGEAADLEPSRPTTWLHSSSATRCFAPRQGSRERRSRSTGPSPPCGRSLILRGIGVHPRESRPADPVVAGQGQGAVNSGAGGDRVDSRRSGGEDRRSG